MNFRNMLIAMLLFLLVLDYRGWAQTEEKPGSPKPFEYSELAEQLLAQADDPARAGGPGEPLPFEEQLPHRRKQLEQLRLIKLLETINLSEEQEGPFIQAFQSLRRANRDLDKQREQVLRQLSEGVNNGAIGKEQVAEATRVLVQNGRERLELHDQFIGRMQTVLAPEQTAKLLLFQEHFEREMLEHLREFRGRGAGRMGNPGEPGMRRQP